MPTELKYTPLSEVKSVSRSLDNAYADTMITYGHTTLMLMPRLFA